MTYQMLKLVIGITYLAVNINHTALVITVGIIWHIVYQLRVDVKVPDGFKSKRQGLIFRFFQERFQCLQCLFRSVDRPRLSPRFQLFLHVSFISRFFQRLPKPLRHILQETLAHRILIDKHGFRRDLTECHRKSGEPLAYLPERARLLQHIIPSYRIFQLLIFMQDLFQFTAGLLPGCDLRRCNP